MNIEDKLDLLAKIIPSVYLPKKGTKFRRGHFHDIVLSQARLKKSHENIKILKVIMKAFGAREVWVQGKQYYAGLPKFWTYRE